jgi:hypothetical protein
MSRIPVIVNNKKKLEDILEIIYKELLKPLERLFKEEIETVVVC